MALYCAVDQKLREHTGIVGTVSAGSPQRLQTPPRLELSLSFADDSLDGGLVAEVKRSFEAELAIVGSLGLEFQPSKMELIPCAGDACDADLSFFAAKGIRVNRTQAFELAKVPIGPREFALTCAGKRLRKVSALMDALTALPDRHAAFYVHRFCCSSSRMTYLARTTPRAVIDPALQEFDAKARDTFEAISGLSLSDRRWDQCKLGVQKTGLGCQ